MWFIYKSTAPPIEQSLNMTEKIVEWDIKRKVKQNLMS